MEKDQPILKPPTVSVWGPPNAGKTSFLAGLYRQAPRHGWRMIPINEDAVTFVEWHGIEIMKGNFPPSTNNTSLYHFRVLRPSIKKSGAMRRHEFTPLDLIVVDTPGDYLFDPKEDEGRENWRILKASDAILVMIDAQVGAGHDAKTKQREKNFLENFARLLIELQRSGHVDRHGRVNVNIAICLTKIDEEEPWKLIKQYGPNDYFGTMILTPYVREFWKAHIANESWKCFALSVVGRFAQEPGKTLSNRIQSGDAMTVLDLENWEPIGLLDPLEWIIDRVETDGGLNEKRSSPLAWVQNTIRALAQNKTVVRTSAISPPTNQVIFSAYYPDSVQTDRQYGLYVYAHLDIKQDEIAKDVQAFRTELGGIVADPKRAKQSASMRHNTPITVVPECDELAFDPISITKKWNSSWLRFDFGFKALTDPGESSLALRVSIRVGSVEIAHISCIIQTKRQVVHTREACETHTQNPLALAKFNCHTSRIYQRIFVSYSRKDKGVVEAYRFAQLAIGNDVFMDTYSIR